MAELVIMDCMAELFTAERYCVTELYADDHASAISAVLDCMTELVADDSGLVEMVFPAEMTELDAGIEERTVIAGVVQTYQDDALLVNVMAVVDVTVEVTEVVTVVGAEVEMVAVLLLVVHNVIGSEDVSSVEEQEVEVLLLEDLEDMVTGLVKEQIVEVEPVEVVLVGLVDVGEVVLFFVELQVVLSMVDVMHLVDDEAALELVLHGFVLETHGLPD